MADSEVLLDAAEQDHDGDSNRNVPRPHPRGAGIRTHLERWKTLYILAAFTFVIDFPSFARTAPLIRLFELAVCREYYHGQVAGLTAADGSIAWDRCQVEPVQARLARLKGLFGMLEVVPGLLLAVPYGILADNWGRRAVIALGLFGVVLAEIFGWAVLTFTDVFPVNALLAFPLFLLIGGGGVVLSAIIFAIIADNSPAHLRTRVFFSLSIITLITELLAPPVGAWLMSRVGASMSFLVGIPTRILAMLLLMTIPERQDTFSDQPAVYSEIPATRSSKRLMLRDEVEKILQHIKVDLLPILRQTVIMLGIASLLITNFARQMLEVVVQYMRVRFGWTYDQAAYIISFQAAVHLLVLLTLLPVVDRFLSKHFDSSKKDLLLAKGSVVFMTIGPLYLGFAGKASGIFIGLVIFTIGVGFGAAVRSFLTSLVPRSKVGLLYTLIAVLTSIGSLVGAPTLGFMFSAGINKGGIALGLPFFFGAALYLLSAICIWAIPISTKPAYEQLIDVDQEAYVQAE